MTETWNILKLLQWTLDYFSHRGIENPRLDAELLISYALNSSRVQLYTQFDRVLEPEELKKIKELIKRRALREPLAYIRGVKEFYSLEFIVSPAVLIPRPETELLVEEVLKNPPNPPLSKGGEGGFKILDLGTGSGCIAITLAKHLPQAQIWAMDISADALEIAKLNAKKHGVENQISFIQGDILLPEIQKALPPFDLIISNPPYIPSDQIPGLAPEVIYEPKLALEGGPDGLHFYQQISLFSKTHLKPNGWIILEIGENQAESLKTLFHDAGFESVEIQKDLAGKNRLLLTKL